MLDFQKEVELHPTHTQARLELAELLLQRNQKVEALKHLEVAKKEGPEVPDVYYALAKVYRSLREAEKALAAAKKGVDLDPNAMKGRYLLAQLYRAAGDLTAARQEMEVFQILQRNQDQMEQQTHRSPDRPGPLVLRCDKTHPGRAGAGNRRKKGEGKGGRAGVADPRPERVSASGRGLGWGGRLENCSPAGFHQIGLRGSRPRCSSRSQLRQTSPPPSHFQ